MKNPTAFLCSALLVPLEPLRYLYATRTLQAITLKKPAFKRLGRVLKLYIYTVCCE